MTADTLDTPAAVERAGVGLWFDETGQPWNHTEDGDWIDRKGHTGNQSGPTGDPSAGISAHEMQMIFLSQARLRRTRPPLAQRMMFRLRPKAVWEYRVFRAYAEHYAQAGHAREELGLARFAWRYYRLRSRRLVRRFVGGTR